MEHWKLINIPNFDDIYNKLDFNSWLCPPIDSSFEFGGSFTSSNFSYTKLAIKTCTRDDLRQPYNHKWNPHCATDTEKQLYLLNPSNEGRFEFSFYFSNYVVNPDQ